MLNRSRYFFNCTRLLIYIKLNQALVKGVLRLIKVI